MFRTIAVHSMGQHHHNSALGSPFLLRRGNIIVNHHLAAVGKVSELGLPHREAIGVLQAVAVFKPQHAILAQVTVVHRVAVCLFLGEAVLPNKAELFAVDLVMHHRVAVGEGASLHILAREADPIALLN